MGDYDDTPSFYTSDDTFEKYLGQTSHYLALQDNLMKIVSHIEPDRIMEMGSGLGQTSVRMVKEYPSTEVLGIDNRETVIEHSRNHVEKRGLSNLAFETAEMAKYVKTTDSLPELVVFLHSFHHIPDPLRRKVEFLEDCYAALPDGGHICIGETFLKSDTRDESARREIRKRWANRGVESYASTFWSALDGIATADIEHAQEIGEFSREHEVEAGENVLARDDEYPISMNWLVDHAQSVGFDVLLAEPVNSLGDGIVLLRK
jgi:ubiquinone/menaquinone biosynthesis C-methylase UbiE